jgi:superfamily I DNA/RNA helicase
MTTTVISASAGAGKTYSLTEKLVEAIRDQGVRPEAVVAITYTNKAAAELARRLRRRLLDAGMGEHAARVRDGYLGTVHSVCQRILADLAFEAGVSPFPAVAPEAWPSCWPYCRRPMAAPT